MTPNQHKHTNREKTLAMQDDSIRLAMVDSLPISSGLAAIALANIHMPYLEVHMAYLGVHMACLAYVVGTVVDIRIFGID